MIVTWQWLIDAARFYSDDDHKESDGWISPARWLQLAYTEYRRVYAELVRMSCVTPTVMQAVVTPNAPTTYSGVLAVLGVGEDLGHRIRMLHAAPQVNQRTPYFRGSTESAGKATSWSMTGSGDALTVELHEWDAPGSNYVIRYIPAAAVPTDPTTSVDLPNGAEELIPLGMARRAMVKESAGSALVERLYGDAQAQVNLTTWGRFHGDSPRVRRVRQTPSNRLQGAGWDGGPASWFYVA